MLSALATIINTSVDKVQVTSLDAARQIGMRFHQIGTAMSGSCTHNNADESTDMNIPRASKDMMDALRRNHPRAFEVYAAAAQKYVEIEDTKKQTEYLEQQAETLLQVLTAASFSKAKNKNT